MLTDTISLQQIFAGSVEVKQYIAERLYQKYAAEILGRDDLRSDLELLLKYARLVQCHMTTLGMAKLCVRCAARLEGGCCSFFMTGETDAIQMLMNMLVGVPVRQVKTDGEECSYLEEKGCLFTFKPIFCLNYICKNIRDSVFPEGIRKLEQLTGQLLSQQYEVEKNFLSFLACEKTKNYAQ
jgi:hypothetical protein